MAEDPETCQYKSNCNKMLSFVNKIHMKQVKKDMKMLKNESVYKHLLIYGSSGNNGGKIRKKQDKPLCSNSKVMHILSIKS